MLAYVFWHRAAPGHDPADYRRALLAFHRALSAGGPSGLRRSLVWWVDRDSWLAPGAGARSVGAEPGGTGSFEDWYLVEDWAVLGELNRGAVTGVAEPRHRAVAGLAGPGTGALYALRGGELTSPAQPCATWLNKPRELSYSAFDEALAEALGGPGTGLWERQLVLGPAPEFCLLSPAPLPIPVAVEQVVMRERLR